MAKLTNFGRHTVTASSQTMSFIHRVVKMMMIRFSKQLLKIALLLLARSNIDIAVMTIKLCLMEHLWRLKLANASNSVITLSLLRLVKILLYDLFYYFFQDFCVLLALFLLHAVGVIGYFKRQRLNYLAQKMMKIKSQSKLSFLLLLLHLTHQLIKSKYNLRRRTSQCTCRANHIPINSSLCKCRANNINSSLWVQ